MLALESLHHSLNNKPIHTSQQENGTIIFAVFVVFSMFAPTQSTGNAVAVFEALLRFLQPL